MAPLCGALRPLGSPENSKRSACSPAHFVEGVHVVDAALGLRSGGARFQAHAAGGQSRVRVVDAARAQILEALPHRLHQEWHRLPA